MPISFRISARLRSDLEVIRRYDVEAKQLTPREVPLTDVVESFLRFAVEEWRKTHPDADPLFRK